MTALIGADQPFGISRKLSYQMQADRYSGRVLYVTFRTAADLSQWLPAPLEIDDPQEGFLKLYELQRRPEHGQPYPPAFSQYYEACIAVLAAPPGEPLRHYNLFMWVSHDWALYKGRAAFGWPKKIANIAMTSASADQDANSSDHRNGGFNVDIDRYGYPVMRVRAQLDPAAPAKQKKPFNGFYSVRHIPAPIDGGDDIRELLVIETRDGWFKDEVWGEASVEFGSAPDEELNLIGPVEVTACVLRNTGWVLPAWPARRLMLLDTLPTNIGAAKPR
ncbi:MAG TPA: acetoacetate decarboxylase family protein [Steroidobacteraceae bacterium]|nr:acetoacetate decarboxylase family protein [Steroidobacteraceae bacterium]